MKSFITKVIAIIAVIAITASFIPAVSANNTNDLFYGRNQLLLMENGEKLVEAYDRIASCVENRDSSATVEDLNLNADSIMTVVSAYRNDPHGHFWLANDYSYSCYSPEHIVTFNPRYNELAGRTEEEFIENKKIFKEATENILNSAGITDSMSEYEKEIRIHDALVTRTDYSYGDSAHNSFGALVNHNAVCDGYAKAFQYLLYLVGIQAHMVSGTGNGGSHAWNLVRIDGEYYYTDITWDDPIGSDNTENNIYHRYFDVTEEELLQDHQWNSPAYGLPTCNSTSASYFAHNPEKIISTTPDIEKIASLFENGIARVYVTGDDPKKIVDWFFNNIYEVAELCGYDLTQSLTLSYSQMDREYHLQIIGTLIEKEVESIIGDLNGDRTISAIDSNNLRRIISGQIMPSKANTIGGDINRDGDLSVIDSNLLKRMLAGM